MSFDPPAKDSDKAKAIRQLTSAKGKLTIAMRNRERYELRAGRPTWTGERTPAWNAWIDLSNACTHAATKVANLEALLAVEYNDWSSRFIGFGPEDVLLVDGDWVCDLDCNGQELCIECAEEALLTGAMHVDSLHCYLLSVGTPEYTVICSSCGKELYHVDEEPDE